MHKRFPSTSLGLSFLLIGSPPCAATHNQCVGTQNQQFELRYQKTYQDPPSYVMAPFTREGCETVGAFHVGVSARLYIETQTMVFTSLRDAIHVEIAAPLPILMTDACFA